MRKGFPPMCNENISEGRHAGNWPEGALPETQANHENVKNMVLENSFQNEMSVREPNHTRVAGNLCNVEIFWFWFWFWFSV